MTGHDHHFLSRLDRVSDEHVELALTLYRDPMLVSLVLSSCHLEEGHERVAIALGPRDLGPYVVVARDGGFVTCLGEGMSPGQWPVISRGKLDAVAKYIPHVHQKLEFAKRVGTSKKGLGWILRDQLMKSGPDFCREDFQAALAVQPVLSVHYLRWMMDAGEAANSLRERLFGVRKCTRSLEEPLHHLFQLCFASGNLAMLAAWDTKSLMETLPSETVQDVRTVAWVPTRQGMSGPMFRGLWAAGRMGKPILAQLKQQREKAQSDLLIWTVLGSITAIGMRHGKLRSEAEKALVPSPFDMITDGPLRDYLVAVSALLVESFRASLADPEAAVRRAQNVARKVMHAELEARGRTDLPLEELPLDLAAQAIRWNPWPFLRADPNLLVVISQLVPWAVTMDVEDFFLPRSVCREVRFPWRPEDTLRLLESQRDYAPRVPERAKHSVGPNAPCPCGSGKKHKKCCGRPGAKVPDPDRSDPSP